MTQLNFSTLRWFACENLITLDSFEVSAEWNCKVKKRTSRCKCLLHFIHRWMLLNTPSSELCGVTVSGCVYRIQKELNLVWGNGNNNRNILPLEHQIYSIHHFFSLQLYNYVAYVMKAHNGSAFSLHCVYWALWHVNIERRQWHTLANIVRSKTNEKKMFNQVGFQCISLLFVSENKNESNTSKWIWLK